MMQEPWFWRSRAPAARALAIALAPTAAAYALGRRIKDAAIRPKTPARPVICVGNATLGGVGKTPFALMLKEILSSRNVHFLTRGYGGRLKGPVLVDPALHAAGDVGDEALLLAARGPTIVSRDRIAGADLAAANGADLIIMDDGLQNRTIRKACSFLLVDADDPDGNGMTFPSGPLRETIREAAAHADAFVSIGSGEGRVAAPQDLPRFRAWLEPERAEPDRVLAFCGIGAPRRFFDMLRAAGYDVAAERPFPDHHNFSRLDMDRLRAEAQAAQARLVTTEKDFVRMPMEMRDKVTTLAVKMRIDNPGGAADLIFRRIGAADHG